MTFEEHRQIHIQLHDSLRQLLGDYHAVTKQNLGNLTVKELFGWSLSQTVNPTSATQVEDSLSELQQSPVKNEEAPRDKNENENIINSQILTTPPLHSRKKRKTKA